MKTKEQIIQIAQKQVIDCLEFRKPRFDAIKRSEDLYFGKVKPALSGRFNFPVPILEGFVETLMSKIDDSIKISFKKGREATLKSAKKVSSAWEKDSSPDRGAFNEADLDAKKLAIFSGMGILKLVPFAKPYKQELTAIDYYDFIFEPHGGRDIEKHYFKGQINIFKNKQELKEGADSGLYNGKQVTLLINRIDGKESKNFQEQAQNKANRFEAMGLTPENYSYIGSDMYNLCELITKVDGVDYIVTFDLKSGIWIRMEELKKVFSSGLSPYTVWHTERNPASFLCRAPVDGIRPVAQAMTTLINQNFDNIQKRNWDMILYNAKKIINPSQLEYRPHGLISVKLKEGESMASAYEKMQTPDTTSISINMLDWMNNFVGEKSGVTPSTQGNSDEQRVGIYFGNMQQAADRFGMINKFYTQSHTLIAKRYISNLRDNMPPRGFMVKFIGLKGVQEEELTKDDIQDDLEVEVVSQNAESQLDEIKQKKRENAFILISKDPDLKTQVSPKWLAEQVLRNGEYDEVDIKSALNKEEGMNAELMSEAAKAIEEILEGGKPKVNRGANLAFIKKIKDYAIEESDSISDEDFVRLERYAMQHFEIAEKNELEAQQMIAQTAIQENGQPNANPENPAIGQQIQPSGREGLANVQGMGR